MGEVSISRYKKLFLTFLFSLLFLISAASSLYALSAFDECILGNGGWPCNLNRNGNILFKNPLGPNSPLDPNRVNVPELVGNFLRAFFGLIGVISLVIFIYGGLLWMTSMGEEERVKRGRETLIWAGLGLIGIFGSYVVVQFILDAVL